MELKFISELEPFILAGRFRKWHLPDEILVNNIVKYYKDNKTPQSLEKIIVNLNFSGYPLEERAELLEFCEKNFLITAIVYLHLAFEKS